jgi:hypothetical protein
VGLFTGIADDVTRTLTHKLVTEPLSDYLKNLLGGNGTASGGGGLLAQLLGFGGGPGAGAANTAQETFRASELAAQAAGTATLTASITAQTVAYTAGASAIAAMTAAASAAATALAAVAASGGASGAGGVFGSLFGGGSPWGLGDMGNMGADFIIPGAASGMDYVPKDMLLKVHEGERIMTKADNRRARMPDVYGSRYMEAGAQRSAAPPIAKAGGDTDVNVTVEMPVGASRQSGMQFGAAAARQMRYVMDHQGVR